MVIIYRDIGNVLQLKQSVQTNIKFKSIRSTLLLTQNIKTNKLIAHVSNKLELLQKLTINRIINLNVSNQLQLTQDLFKGDIKYLKSWLTLYSNVKTITNNLHNQLFLTQTLIAYKPIISSSQLNLTQTVTTTLSRKRNVSNTLQLKNSVRYLKINKNGQPNLCESQVIFDIEETDN